jgi:hypothetical protein
MKRAALGIQMHSGWGVLVALSVDAGSVEILDRRRVVTADPEKPGANQPYHYASRLELADSEKHLASCAAASLHLARTAVEEVVKDLHRRRYRVIGSAVLLASGRPLPPLAKVLSAHPLIHTAEGEFFRHVVCQACEDLQIAVTAIKERELDGRAKAAFGVAATRVQLEIASLGTSIGPPWTKDHKTAALAAAVVLVSDKTAGAHSRI